MTAAHASFHQRGAVRRWPLDRTCSRQHTHVNRPFFLAIILGRDMSHSSFTCEQCGKTFATQSELLGKRVKCAGCGNVFVVNQQPCDSPSTDAAMPRTEMAQPESPAPDAEMTKESSFFHMDWERGPTDRQFRVGSLFVIAVTILGTLLVISFEKIDIKGLIILAFGPFAVFYGFAALVDPNIVRAVGKYGKHLSMRYKIIGGVIGVAALAVSGGMSLWLYFQHIH